MKKTITITFEVQDSVTLKGSIMEKISKFNENKELAISQTKQRVEALHEIKNEVLAQLNKEVGEDVWFIDRWSEGSYSKECNRRHVGYKGDNYMNETAFAVKISFKDGVVRNTCYNDWDLYIQSPNEEIKYGKLDYLKPNLDIIEMYLVGSEQNRGKVYLIKDISEIHTYLEKDYITYFTMKNR